MPLSYMTHHGRRRLQSRAIPNQALELVLAYGRPVHKQGAVRYYLDGAARRKLEAVEGKEVLRRMGHKLDIFAVIGADEGLVTAAYRTRRIKH